MNRVFVLLWLVFPLYSLSFSETEIDSLESSGTKSFSPSPWRIQFNFSLQRNLEVNSRLSNLFNTKTDTSLLDLSNLYYSLSAVFNYSLQQVKNSPNWIKNTEIFLVTSFSSPFTGHFSNLKNYSTKDYIQFGLGDIVGGLTLPVYKKEAFLSYFSLSAIAIPLSRFSKKAGLTSSISGTFSTLYFLKKGKGTSLTLSSNHNLSYSQYSKDVANKIGSYYNIPCDTTQSFSLIYRQKQSQKMPSNIRGSISHYFGINTNQTQLQDLILGLATSWKIKKQFYLNLSIRWKDRIYIYNPNDEKISKKEPIRFNLSKTFFSLGGSYSF